ncbi:MAG: FtsK/SpoIIIE domain-containing protein [Patescibacteria group bacterium]|jgi:S-DNA-T family DNA segregation ATPase FtsK/SpoIIIE
MQKDLAINSLNNLLKQLKLKAEIESCKVEDSFLIFDIKLGLGGTFKKLEKCATEIALALKALSEPLIYPVTKEGIIKMEVMIDEQQTVFFKDFINTEKFINSDAILPLALGGLRDGSPLIVDLTKMPHLLVSGATGSGKSILLQTVINSLLINTKAQIKLALIDPKRVEFTYYNDLDNLYSPIAKNVESALTLLNNLIDEMDSRFLKLEKCGARDILSYKGRMPYIVVVIDELADLMMASKKEAQYLICRLAQKSRACGIHLVIATQRPSVNVVTGIIKANFPARLSCQVSAAVDSRTILDRNGAETLVGKGDAIIDCGEYKFKRFKGSFLTSEDIIKNVNNNKKTWLRRLWNS